MRVCFLFFCEDTQEGYKTEFQKGEMQLLNGRADLRTENQNSTSLCRLILLKARSK